MTSPKKLAPHVLSHHIQTICSPLSDSSSLSSSLSTLLPHDQLRQQTSLSKTLYHLEEAPITFPPTYKFKPGTRDTYKTFTKRIPGWCDRILYLSNTADEVECELYRSEMDFTASDHKPVRFPPSLSSFPCSQSLHLTIGRRNLQNPSSLFLSNYLSSSISLSALDDLAAITAHRNGSRSTSRTDLEYDCIVGIREGCEIGGRQPRNGGCWNLVLSRWLVISLGFRY